MSFSIRTILFYLCISSTSAQVVNSSIFSGVKSLNPAVISRRESATIATYVKVDQANKEQDLTPRFGQGSTSNEKGSLSSYNLFYGGKGGPFTTEFLADISSGKQKYEVSLPSTTQTGLTSSDEADSTFFGLGLGIGRYFGLSLSRLSLDVKSNFSTTINIGGVPTAISTAEDITIATNRLRIGMAANMIFDFGAYYQLEQEEMKNNSDDPLYSGTRKKNYSLIGFGVGAKTKKYHYEFFYEKKLSDIEFGEKKLSPSRFGGIIEIHFGFISLGYTGMYYQGGFSDLERSMFDQLILSSTKYESRLENTINFSFGGGKGHSFGGSIFYSKINSSEGSKLDDSGKFDTITTTKSASLNYSYSF